MQDDPPHARADGMLTDGGRINDGFPDPPPGFYSPPLDKDEPEDPRIPAIREFRRNWPDARLVLGRADKRPVQKEWQRRDVPTDEATRWLDRDPTGLVGVMPGTVGPGLAAVDADRGGSEPFTDALGKPLSAYPSRKPNAGHGWYKPQAGGDIPYQWLNGEVRFGTNGFVWIHDWPKFARELTPDAVEEAVAVDLAFLPAKAKGKTETGRHDYWRGRVHALVADFAGRLGSDAYRRAKSDLLDEAMRIAPFERDLEGGRTRTVAADEWRGELRRMFEGSEDKKPGAHGANGAPDGATWRDRFRLVSLKDVEAVPGSFVDRRCLFPKGRLVVLFGKGEVGKGRFMMKQAAECTSGKMFEDSAGRAVIYLSQEDDAGETVKAVVAANGGDPAKVYVVAMAGEDSADTSPGMAWCDPEAILATIAECPEEVALVFLDPLRNATSRISGANHEDSLRQRLLDLNRAAKTAGVTLCGSNHAVKAAKRTIAEGGDIADIMRDSGAYRDHARQLLHICAADDGRRLLAVTNSNHGQAWRECYRLEEVGEAYTDIETGLTFDQVRRLDMTVEFGMGRQEFTDACYRLADPNDPTERGAAVEDFCREACRSGGMVAKARFREVYNSWARMNGHATLAKGSRAAPVLDAMKAAGFDQADDKRIGKTNTPTWTGLHLQCDA